MPSVALDLALPRLTDPQQAVPWAKHLVESLHRHLFSLSINLNGMAVGNGVPLVETFDGPATGFVLTQPSLQEIVQVNGIGLRKVTEYTVAGSTVTPTRALGAGEWASIAYWTSGAPAYQAYAGPTGTLTLPASAVRAMVFVNGVGLRLVASAPGTEEFTLSGTTVTLGRTIGVGEVAWVYYWT